MVSDEVWWRRSRHAPFELGQPEPGPDEQDPCKDGRWEGTRTLQVPALEEVRRWSTCQPLDVGQMLR